MPLEALTAAQQELYDWLAEFIADNRHSPSIRQMMQGMGLRSPAPIQSRLRHRSILRMVGWFHNPKSAFLVLEHAPNGEVFRRLKAKGRLDEATAANYMKQLVEAVAYMHACHVIHRDIKPENLLLGADGSVKVADFGAAIHAPPPHAPLGRPCVATSLITTRNVLMSYSVSTFALPGVAVYV